jgi:L-malate glycosyltransferase
LNKKILIVPSRYPTEYQPHNYIFVKDQAEILAKNYEVKVRGVITISFRELMKKGILSLGVVKYNKNNVDTKLVLIPSIPKCKKINNFIRNLGNYLLIRGIVKDIDIVHIHSYLAGDVGIKIKNKLNKDYFITEHSSTLLSKNISRFDYELAYNVFRNSNKTFAVSSSFAKELEKKFKLKIDVLYNVVDTDFFKPTKINNEKFIFLTIGNLVKVKNHELLINSFSKVFKNVDNVLLQIIGDGVEFSNLKELIIKNEMDDKIKLLGYKNKNEIKEYFNLSSVFVMTSIKETFCVALIEAMSMAKPIISTDFGGVIEEIKNLNDCKIVENNVERLSISMLNIFNAKKDESFENRKYIINNFSKKSFLLNFKKKVEKR